MSFTRRPLALLGLLLATTLGVPGAAAAAPGAPRVPVGFVGMNIDGPMLSPQIDAAHQFNTMVSAGVQRVRIAFDWGAIQPYASWSQVPAGQAGRFTNVGGIPTDFSSTDRFMTLAADHGFDLLPTLLDAPSWAIGRVGLTLSEPKSPALFATFVRTMVERYKPAGTFFALHPGLGAHAVRSWQIWNEPDLPNNWPDRPWIPGYVRLLRAAHDAVKSADPQAFVVLCGTPDYSWRYLAEIYRIPGARSLFDVVAVHPYTKVPGHVIGFLHLVRDVMDRNGDGRKPMVATEVSFPSSMGQTDIYGFETDERGQAVNTAAAMVKLAASRRRLRLIGFYLYTWMGNEYPHAFTFNFGGLLRWHNGTITVKPALAAFRQSALKLEGCRRKGPVAGDCF